MGKSNKIKKIIPIMIAIVLIIIIMIVILIICNNQNGAVLIDIKSEPTSPENLEPERELKESEDVDGYFIVKEIIGKYYLYSKNLNMKASDIETYGNDISQEELEKSAKIENQTAQTTIYNMLDKSYISEFNIKEENLIQKFGIENDVEIFIKKVYSVENTLNVSTYFVTGMLIDRTEEKNLDFELGVSLDMLNNTFCIYPEEYLKKHNYDKLNIGDKLEINIESIENRDYNTFEYKFIKDNIVSQEYFNNYKYAMLYDINYAYDMLDEDYKEKRYGSLDNYKKYIQENYDNLSNRIVTQYQVTQNDEIKKYVCLDNFGNYYIFTQKNISNYTLELDTYTIESQEFLSKYNSGDDMKKAGMNVEKFFEALNTKDYVYVYEHLADSFKNNNYPTKESFEEYIKQNLFTFTGKEYINYNIQGSVHIFKLKVSNKEEESQQKNMTVMVKLKEKTDFEISFSIE